VDQPRVKLNATGKKTYGQLTSFVTTDGTNVYWAGLDPYSPDRNLHYIFGTSVATGAEVTFAAGNKYTSSWFSTYNNVIDKIIDVNGAVTGIAVQRKGSYLFASHGKLGKVHVLSKTNGTLIRKIDLPDCGEMVVDADDNLWIQVNKTITKYTVNADGTLTITTHNISGLEHPLGLNISADQKIIAVCDGGSSQQVKAFDITTGALLWTLGQAGGYSKNAVVSTDKFFFSGLKTPRKSCITFQADGSFWVSDTENGRLLKFNANREFAESIMFLPHSRSCSVDPNNPARITSDYLEFEIDYAKPLSSTNGSWKLVRNWAYTVPNDKDDEYVRLINTTTLKNGKVYAFVRSNVKGKKELVEMVSGGNLRYTGITVGEFTSLYADGSLRRADDFKPGIKVNWLEKKLVGFYGDDPVWGPENVLASSTPATLEDPLFRFTVGWGVNTSPLTSSGLLITYEGGSASPDWASKKYHLGAIKPGTNQWMWKTAKGTSPSYTGPYPTDGSYDMGNGVQYPGGPILVKDQHIFWNYHGEFWKQTQTNKWQHVSDEGLLIGVFGVTGRDVYDGKEIWHQEAVPQMAGNSLTGGIAEANGDYYIYHCDESHHGGVHRWKVSNLNSIRKEVIQINTKLSLILNNNSTLAVKAIEKDETIHVTCQLQRMDSAKVYTLEKATDNTNFGKIANIPPAAGPTFIWVDKNPAQGINRYRIRVTDELGSSQFSDIANCGFKARATGLEVSPNPANGRNVTVKFKNIASGNYVLSIVNNNQQVAFQKRITHGGGTATHNIAELSNFPRGVYHVLVSGNLVFFKQQLLN
jgi:hypothetical protein